MLRNIDEAILEALEKGMNGLVSPGEFSLGEHIRDRRGVCIVNTDFTINEPGIGSFGAAMKEVVSESFEADGKKTEFKLKESPVKPLIRVETPAGTKRNDPDDYTVDYGKGIVSFRNAPEEKEVVIVYNTPRAVGEIRRLKFDMTYEIAASGEDVEDRDKISMGIIRALYMEKALLSEKGVEEITPLGGYLTGDDARTNILEYRVEATVSIEIPMTPMASIDIGRTKTI